MPHMDHSGPEGKGAGTGRKLGVCSKTDVGFEGISELGKGQAKRRKEDGGEGKGRRLQYDKAIRTKN